MSRGGVQWKGKQAGTDCCEAMVHTLPDWPTGPLCTQLLELPGSTPRRPRVAERQRTNGGLAA